MNGQLRFDGREDDDPAVRVVDQHVAKLGDLDVLVTTYGDSSMACSVRTAGAATWGRTVELRPWGAA